MPKPTDDGKTWTFKIRDGVKWHDGSPLTAADVAASWQEIVHPRAGVSSARESYFIMVDSIEAPDPSTVVFHLKFATGAFLPALADPFAWIYKKATLDKDPHWYEKNMIGSGPFKFDGYEIGQSIKGVRNPDYYHKGLPYLDGFRGDLRRQGEGAGRRDPRRPRGRWSSAACPRRREDQLVRSWVTSWPCRPATGTAEHDHDRIMRKSRSTTCVFVARWSWRSTNGTARRRLSKVANVRTVGGMVFPGSPLGGNQG